MYSLLARWCFKLAGWRLTGWRPSLAQAPRGIWVAVPHNSNWDFLVGLGTRAATRIWIHYLAKKELFTWYAGWLFKALGGMPVDRSRANNLVDAMADILKSHDRLHICIAPEGTRGDVVKLKTGFYYIALKSGAPLILVGFDYPRKQAVLSAPFYVTGDYQKDMTYIYEFFSQIQGKHKTWLRQYEETGVIG
ncbi:1-acyl-sn-glycerol-3-phosphate acyltransferase [Nibrella saemangeumensis]|uniref:1-acyl-sn-glycerol-3-phosphate acyltransferase n=1 Tax=Nibrella saemangeumensis TaxID=1084526 RepID=UPI0031EEF780